MWQYLATLSYGVTTTRDPQTATTDILSYTDRVRTGQIVGPRIYSTGPGVFLSENIRDAGHAKTILRRYSQYFDTKTIKMYMTGNRQQRQWIIQAARELQLMPTTEGGLDFKIDMTHAIDGYPGVEHNLPIAPIYSDVVELFKESETTNSPTLLVSYGGPFGENYFYATENVHDDPKLNVFVPSANIDARARRRGPGGGGSPGQAGWFLEEEYVFPRTASSSRRCLSPVRAWAWAVTDNCRVSATTGKCGPWLPEAPPITTYCARRRSWARRRSALARLWEALKKTSSLTF